MSGAESISLNGVTRRHPAAQAPAVCAVTLNVAAGETLALLGPSGAGKSTLLRLIAGLEPVEDGSIRIGAAEVSSPARHTPPERRRVGLVFQDYALFPHLTAAGNVAFGLLSADKAARRAAAQTWLDRVGLGARADAYPHELSGGEQQRVALARALAPQPAAVLLDEPFSGLDPALRGALRELTQEAIATAGATAVFVTHDAEEAFAVADRVAVLHAGRLIQAGAPREVYERPAALEAAAALGPVTVFETAVRAGRVDTPFGALPAPGLAESTPVAVAVRRHGLLLQPGEGAVVRTRRALGALDLVTVEAGGVLWRCLAAPEAPGAPGETVAARFAPSGVFVFPR